MDGNGNGVIPNSVLVNGLHRHGDKPKRPKPPSRSRVMGNSTTSAVLHEEDEPALKMDDEGYEIRSIVTDSTCHSKDSFGRPVIIFDRWKILQSDLKDRQDKMVDDVFIERCAEAELSNQHSQDSDSSSSRRDICNSLQELSTTCVSKSINGEIQKTSRENAINSKSSIVKKPRPNSLAILSRSHDLLHTIVDQEVAARAAEGYRHTPSAAFLTNAPLSRECRAASADTLLQQTRPGLQRRRNQRPTSLQIPNILHVPPETIRTAQSHGATTHHLSVPSNAPTTVRQRSYSMPTSTFLDIAEKKMATRPTPFHSLDEAVTLLGKKKIGKAEVDEQSLLHRAADEGHVKLVKRCIQSGCSVMKRLNSLNGTSALHCAARADKNSAQITKLLLESGIDVNTRNDLEETAIFSAIIHKNMDTVGVLVEHGCDINSVWQESTPIYLMIYNGDVENTRKMINYGAQVTRLPDKIRQPLHAVLDLCHNQAITYQTMQLLKLMVEADGGAVEHLLSYCGNRPNFPDQDLVYHIYRMENGPVQNEGKLLIHSLIELGYTPTRGELSTMSQTDSKYDYLYSYIKSGPSPLKDLCVRAIRGVCAVNVTHAMSNCMKIISNKEKLQILLQPPIHDHDYENVEVFTRDKSPRKSRHKSFKDIMSGIGRLSRRLSKRHEGHSGTQLTLPPKELSLPTEHKSKPKPPIKPKPNIKPKYLKRESQKRSSVTAVADIVKRYSISEARGDTATVGDGKELDEPMDMSSDNSAYIAHEPETVGTRKYVSSIAVDENSLELEFDPNGNGVSDCVNGNMDNEVTVRFNNSYMPQEGGNMSERIQTPMANHAPDTGSSATGLTIYKGRIHIEDEDC